MDGTELVIQPIFNENTLKFKIIDQTPWPTLAADGVTPVLMTITGVGPSGSAFPTATVEIDYATSNYEEETGWFQLPKVAGQNAIQPGAYVFTAEVEIDYAITGAAIEFIGTAAFAAPGDYSFIEAGETVTLSGCTNVGNNGAKTVIGAVYNEEGDITVITCAFLFTPESPTSPGTFAYSATGKTVENEFSYTYSECDHVTVSIESSVDCTAANGAGSMAVTDATTIPSGQTVLNGTGTNTTKRISVTYPVGLVPAPAADPKTTYNSVLAISPIADTAGDQFPFVAVVVLDMQCEQDDGLIIWYTVRGQKSISVVCENSLCGLASCINDAVVAYAAQLNKGIPDPGNMAQLTLINAYQQQYALAISCGEYTDAQTALTNLKELLGSECTCGNTTADAPSWLNDSGGLVYTPSWLTNSFFKVWASPQVYSQADTDIQAEAEDIVVGADLVANIGDQVIITVEGYSSGGSGEITVENDTTQVDYLATGSFASATSFKYVIVVTRVDGDLASWVMSRSSTLSGSTTISSSNNPTTSDWNYEEDNIIQVFGNANTYFTNVSVYVSRTTDLPE